MMNANNWLKTMMAAAAVSAGALGAAPSAHAGEASITGVKMQQRYPWNGLVDIEYTADGVIEAAETVGLKVPAKVTVLAVDKTTHVTNVADAACLSGDASYSNGTHTIVWDMDKQGLTEMVAKNAVVEVLCDVVNGEDYATLQNKPAINGVQVTSGDRTSADYRIFAPTEAPSTPGNAVAGQFVKWDPDAGKAVWATSTPSDVGLANVNNTSDADKPVSTATGDAINALATATQAKLDEKQDKVAKLGSSTQPVYTSDVGTFKACSTYAGGTKVTLNNTNMSAKAVSFYAPTSGGYGGYILKGNGTKATPTWQSKSDWLGVSSKDYSLGGLKVHLIKTGRVVVATVEGTTTTKEQASVTIDNKFKPTREVCGFVYGGYGSWGIRLFWVNGNNLNLGGCSDTGEGYRGSMTWVTANADL